MSLPQPVAELSGAFSSPGATPTPWAEARDLLIGSQVYWLATVRRDGRPHVTPVAGVWVDDAPYVTTGITEQKRRNLEHNRHCALISGSSLEHGVDVVVEAEAIVETDPAMLRAVADAYRAKYGDLFVYVVRDGSLRMEDDGEVVCYRLRADKAFAFGRGEVFSQTRWRFER